MSTSNNPRFSNAISNIDINSYRAYKNLLKANNNTIFADKNSKGKLDNLNSNLSRNKNQDNFIQAKNLTKHIFSSQSKRFEWQTNEAINRHSELNGSMISMRHKDLNSDNWKGFTNLNEDDKISKNFEKFKK